MKTIIQNLKNNSYQLDLNQILMKSFTLYKSIFLPSALLIIIGIVAITTIYTNIVLSYYPSIEAATEAMMSMDVMNFNSEELIQYFGLNATFHLVLVLVNLLIFDLAKQTSTHGTYKVLALIKNIFSFTTLQILFYTFTLHMFVSFLSYYLQVYGLGNVSLFLSLMIHTLTLFVLPIAVYEKTNVLKAIKYSSDLVNIKPLRILSYLIFITILSLSGIFLFGIGIVFSFPLFYIFVHELYVWIRSQGIN